MSCRVVVTHRTASPMGERQMFPRQTTRTAACDIDPLCVYICTQFQTMKPLIRDRWIARRDRDEMGEEEKQVVEHTVIPKEDILQRWEFISCKAV